MPRDLPVLGFFHRPVLLRQPSLTDYVSPALCCRLQPTPTLQHRHCCGLQVGAEVFQMRLKLLLTFSVPKRRCALPTVFRCRAPSPLPDVGNVSKLRDLSAASMSECRVSVTGRRTAESRTRHRDRHTSAPMTLNSGVKSRAKAVKPRPCPSPARQGRFGALGDERS